LGAGRHVAFHGQMAEKGLDFRAAHLARMPLIVEENESLDPIDVGSLGPYRVMQQPHLGTNLIEQFRGLSGSRRQLRIHENLLANEASQDYDTLTWRISMSRRASRVSGGSSWLIRIRQNRFGISNNK
jgi:hypothetical protein